MSAAAAAGRRPGNADTKGEIIEAAKPLYLNLDDTQKHKFITLGRMLVPERGRFVKAMRHQVKGTP